MPNPAKQNLFRVGLIWVRIEFVFGEKAGAKREKILNKIRRWDD